MLFAVGTISRRAQVWLTACGLCLWAGCSRPQLEDPSQVVQVHGKVLYNGRSIAGAQLVFHRENAAESAFAVTDAQGQFTGMTNDTSGMFPGDYRVTVTHPMLKLPKKYADIEASPLDLVVLDDETEQEFPVQLSD